MDLHNLNKERADYIFIKGNSASLTTNDLSSNHRVPLYPGRYYIFPIVYNPVSFAHTHSPSKERNIHKT